MREFSGVMINMSNEYNVINGPGLLYQAIRDVAVASRIGTGEGELNALIAVMPKKSRTKALQVSMEQERETQRQVTELVEANTEPIGHPSNGETWVNEAKIKPIITQIVRRGVLVSLAAVVSVLDEDGYLYAEQRVVEKGGTWSEKE